MDPSDHDQNDLKNGAAGEDDGPTHATGQPGEGDRWLRSVVQNSSEIVTIVDPDGTLRYANPAWERALGYDPEKAIGTMNVLDHVHPEDLGHVLEETEQALSEEGITTNEAEYRFRRKDGSWRWMQSVGTYLLEDPAVGGVVVVSRDITERKEAEEALRRNEQYFRSLVQNASDVITVLEADGTIRYVSPAVEWVTGYRPEEQAGTNAFDSVHPEDKGRALGLFAGILETPGVHPPIGFRMPHKDGSWRYLEHVVNNLLDDPSVNGIVVTSRDVTERKEAEERLREAEERYRNLVERVPAVVYVQEIGSPDSAMYMSPRIEALTGYTPEECKNPALRWRMVHPEDRERMQAEDERTGEPGKVFTNEYRVVHRDGRTVWVRNESVLVEDEVSGTRYWQGFMLDITGRKEAEEAIEWLAHRNELILDSAGEGIYGLDREGRTTFVNPAAAALTGYDADELLGRDQHEVIHHSRPDGTPYPREECPIHPAIGEGSVRRVHEEVFWRKDGTQFPVEYTSTPILEDGEVVGTVVTFTDITERKEAEEALRKSEERHRIQSRELSLLHQVRSALAQELDLTSVFYKVVEAIAETYGYTQVSAYLLEGEDLLLQHQVGYERVIERIPVTEGVCGRTVRTGQPVLIEDVRTDPGFLGAIGGVTSEICVPLFDEGKAVGCFNVESTGGVKLTQKDLGMMVALGEHVSVALNRAKLHTRVRHSEEHFRALTQNSSDIVTLLGAVGTIRYQSPSIERILGYRPEEMIGDNAFDYVHPDDRERVEMAFAEGLVDPGRRPSAEYRFRHKNGSWVWLESVGTNLLDDPGVGEYVVNSRDVTERKKAEEALKQSEERYRTVVEEQTELVCRFLPDLTLTFVNDAYCRYFGLEPREVIGESFIGRVAVEDRVYYEQQLAWLNKENPSRTVEHRVLMPDGGVRWQQWTDTAIFDGEGRIVEYQSVGRDVTERRTLEERLEHQALHDSLTGLPNRRLFVDRLEQALRRTRRRKGRRVAVLFMDLDEFKVVNDSLGHEAGDLLLTVVAQRLRRCLRPEDTLARFGGDEFVVLIEAVDDPAQTIRVAERITEELRRPFIMEGRELYVAASIGISMGHSRTHDPDGLLREADTAMYRAKAEGSGYKVFDQAMYERALRRLEVENDLRRAIEREEFVIHYQPIINLQTGAVWGVEALVRWDHPERGLLDPDEFVPVAEESGLVVPMGELVLQEACRRAAEWQREFPRTPPLAMSVNLSGRQLRRPDLHEVIGQALKESGLSASSLGLDIIETVYISALDANTAALDRLKALGIRISLDDFGSGYSSLSYLKRLPADILKIDKSFTKGLGVEVEDTAIVQTVVELAHILGIEVVAEGVEIEEQETLLKEMGCDFAQGFQFAKPLPSEAVSKLLAK